MRERKKICFVVAVPGTARVFLRDHIARLSQAFDVYLAGDIQSPDDVSMLDIKGWHRVKIKRAISIAADVRSVVSLARYLRSMRFDAVHSVTPKAGLATALAARLAGIPHRTHIFTGQVWATRSGASRLMLKSIDKLIAALDNHILVDGPSQRRFLIEQGVVSEAKSQVLGPGSIAGVNTARFQPSPQARSQARSALGIAPDKLVFAFMGRLNRDKGVPELLEAFSALAPDHPQAVLLLFGNDEERIADTFASYPGIKPGSNLIYPGLTREPELMLQAADAFVLPTHREGFGTSVLEAQCLGLPAITSDAYGVVDTTIDGLTGLRCPVGDPNALLQAMRRLADDAELRAAMGREGRKRVLDTYRASGIVDAWEQFYRQMLSPDA